MFDVDENTLIARTQQGDRKAFNPLVIKYQPKIEAMIYGQIHNRETAQDLTQDTFVKAYNAIRDFKGQCAFYTWLYRIAQNGCIDPGIRSGIGVRNPSHKIEGKICAALGSTQSK